MRLDKGDRAKLWARINSADFDPYRAEIKGAWHFTAHHDESAEGPHIWIVGSVHGNEAVGAVVIEKLMRLAAEGALISRGEVTFVLGNPSAFLDDVRYIDRDLNRAFALVPEDADGVEGDRQLELHRLLACRPPNFVLDLHSVSSGDHGIIVYPEESIDWAWQLGCIGTHFCYSHDHMAGKTLIDAAHQYGAKAMVVECGHHHSQNTSGVALAHIDRLLKHFEMSQGGLTVDELPAISIVTRYKSIAMIKPNSGFRFLSNVETGTQVKAGVTFAVDRDKEHKTARDAWLMMPSLVVNADDEDAGWICSRELIPQVNLRQDDQHDNSKY